MKNFYLIFINIFIIYLIHIDKSTKDLRLTSLDISNFQKTVIINITKENFFLKNITLGNFSIFDSIIFNMTNSTIILDNTNMNDYIEYSPKFQKNIKGFKLIKEHLKRYLIISLQKLFLDIQFKKIQIFLSETKIKYII